MYANIQLADINIPVFGTLTVTLLSIEAVSSHSNYMVYNKKKLITVIIPLE